MARAAHLRDEVLGDEALVIEDDSSGDAVEVQRSLDVDEQDRSLGMDTYCLVRAGASFYGGVVEWNLVGAELVLRLSDDAATSLDLPVTTSIDLTRDAATVVATHLGRLLAT